MNGTRLIRPRTVTCDGEGLASRAGLMWLAEAADLTGLAAGLVEAFDGQAWRRHHPGRTMAQVTLALADGATCLSDLAVLRNQPALAGPVASEPTVWRTFNDLGPVELRGIVAARASSRERAWAAGAGPDGELLVIDIDATIVTTKADKQDDLLVQEFSSLQVVDNEHVAAIPLAEKEVKYRYFQSWIQQTLDTIASVDADKFSGGNAYLLLALIFRIDFLIAPEGKLLSDLEKINGIYFKKDERQTIEKNQDMVDAFKKLQSLSKEDVMNSLIKSKHTFSIVSPQQYKVIADSINGANTNMKWYVDNNYPFFATQINEYGISYCQYSYSIPRVITEFFHLYMMINYADYFTDLGFGNPYFNAKEKRFSQQAILDKIATIQGRWREKFPLLEIKTQNLRFDSLINFNTSFTTELSLLNTEAK